MNPLAPLGGLLPAGLAEPLLALRWAWPWMLATAPLPWLSRLLPAATPANHTGLQLPFLDQMLAGTRSIGAAAGPARRRLAWLAWLLLVIAAARPQWLGPPLPQPLSGRDLMLAVDISNSMRTPDYQLDGITVDRLHAVKAVAGDFIERRHGDRLGLILFGSRAYLQTPLTHDRSTVRQLLEEAVIGLAGPRTAIGDALGLAIKRLRDADADADAGDNGQRGHADPPVLILLTDGANTAGVLDPRQAANLAAQAGLRVYTIAIGGRGGHPMGGNDLDAETLAAIASTTGGRHYQAGDARQLAQIYAELDRLEPAPGESEPLRPLHELYPWPLGAALLLALTLGLVPAARHPGGRHAG